MRDRLYKFFLIFIVFLIVSARFPHRIRLTYNPPEGSSSTYRMTVKALSIVTDLGKMAHENAPQDFTTYGEFIFTNKVEKVDQNGLITERVTYEDAKLEMEVGGVRTPLDFGSEMKGASFTTKTAQNGELVEAKGLENLAAPEIKNLRLGNMYSQMNPMFPLKEIAVGDTWENESISTLPIMGTVVKTTLKTKYILSGFKTIENHNCAVIQSEIQTETETSTVKKDGDFVTDISMRGEGTGEIFYDYEKSKIISCKTTMDMTSSINMTALNETSTMTTSQKIDMSMNLIKQK